MLAALSALGDALVATESSNARALPATDLAGSAAPYFEHVEAVADPDARRFPAPATPQAPGARSSSPARSICSPISAAFRPARVPWDTSASG